MPHPGLEPVSAPRLAFTLDAVPSEQSRSYVGGERSLSHWLCNGAMPLSLSPHMAAATGRLFLPSNQMHISFPSFSSTELDAPGQVNKLTVTTAVSRVFASLPSQN